MLLEEMREDVRARIGEDAADFWKDADINRYLNAGVTRFCHEEKWDWLFHVYTGIPVALGEPEIELIDDVDYTRHTGLALRPSGDSTDSRLITPVRIPVQRGLELRQTYYTQAEPQFFYLSHVVRKSYEDPSLAPDANALVIRMLPTPERAYVAEFSYFKNPASMVDGDYCVVPEPYQDAVIAWATGMCWL